jgi:Camelysin metallo-endopeptidase
MTDGQSHHRRVGAVVAALCVLLAAGLPLGLWFVASQSSASFADAEVLEANHLGAATLDIAVGTSGAVLRAANMAPGDVVSGQLELTNAGTLPLRFGITARTGGGILSQWLLFELWAEEALCLPGGASSPLVSNVRLSSTSTPLARLGDDGLTLAPGESAIWCLGAALPLTSPNEVQGQRLDVDLVIDAEHDIEAQP